MPGGPGNIDAMIKADAVNWCFITIGNQPFTNAFWKSDDRLRDSTSAESFNDAFGWLTYHAAPEMCRHSTSPAVKQHQGIRASLRLDYEKFDGCRCHNIKQFIEFAVIVPHPFSRDGKIT